MKKLIAGLALSLLGAVAHAQWIEITNNSSGVIFFVDPTSKKRTGDFVRLWSIQNLSRAGIFEGKAYLSLKIFEQFNCKEELSRMTSVLVFSGQMGAGEVVATEHKANAEWLPVAPDTAGQDVFRYACK